MAQRHNSRTNLRLLIVATPMDQVHSKMSAQNGLELSLRCRKLVAGKSISQLCTFLSLAHSCGWTRLKRMHLLQLHLIRRKQITRHLHVPNGVEVNGQFNIVHLLVLIRFVGRISIKALIGVVFRHFQKNI